MEQTLHNEPSQPIAIREDFPELENLHRFRHALKIADRAHAGQRDKAGELKICHALRVGASLLPDIEAAVVGVLHDVVEDTDVSLGQLVAELYLTDAQANAIALLTRPVSDHSYEDYIRTIATAGTSGGAIARRVKVADLRDNLDPRRQTLAQQKVGLAVMVEKRMAYWQALCLLGAAPQFLNPRG